MIYVNIGRDGVRKAINPDHIAYIESQHDATIVLIGGQRIPVRDSIDDIVGQFLAFKAQVLAQAHNAIQASDATDDLGTVSHLRLVKDEER